MSNFSHPVTMNGTLQMSESSGLMKPYTPDWKSLDSHPLPAWFDQVKYGMFIHWGPYSSEDCGNLEHMNPDCLTAENFHPEEWAQLAVDAGMKYVIFTCKHGGGFAMYKTRFGKWNSVDSGPKRDFFGELMQAYRKAGLRVIAYYCKNDIFMPAEEWPEGKSQITDPVRFSQIVNDYDMQWACDHWPEFMREQIKEICEQYQPDGFWFDGVVPKYQYSGMQEVYAWIYNHYPEMVLNDRVGCFSQRKCHGDYYTYERPWIKPVHILPHKWQAERCLAGRWAYEPTLTEEQIEPAEQVLWELLDILALGGNYCLNIAPRADGSIPEYYSKRLLEVGDWLSKHAQAIYATLPWIWGYFAEGENIRYVMSQDEQTIYAFVRNWTDALLDLNYMHSSVCVAREVELLGGGTLEWTWGPKGSLQVRLPESQSDSKIKISALRIPIERESESVGEKRDG